MLSSTWRAFPPAARRFLIGSVLVELGHAFLWALQNLYVRAVGFGEQEAGQVLAAGALGVVLSTLPAAQIYERLGPRRSLSLAGAVAALALTGLACSESLIVLKVWAALQGAAFTLHRVVAAPFLIAVAKPGQRTRLFGAEMATHTVASAVGLASAGILAGRFQAALGVEAVALRYALIVGGLLALSAVWAYRRLPDSTGVEHRAPAGRGTYAILRPRHWHLWTRLALPHFVIGMGAGLTIPFVNLYFTDRFGVAKDGLGLIMATSQITMTVGVLVQPRLVDRIGLLKATLLTEALSLPFFVLLAFTGHFGLAMVAYVFRSALMNLSHPVWRQLMMELSPIEWRAAVNGVSMLAWNAGWALSNERGGRLIEVSAGWLGEGTDGFALPMVITCSLYVLAIGLEAAFFWRHRELGKTVTRIPSGGP